MTMPEGLDGVVVAETRLSHIDGEAGRLLIRGFPLEKLAGQTDFEGICGLLWDGTLPGEGHARLLRQQLGRARCDAFLRLAELGDALRVDDGMSALRAAVAHVPADEPAVGPGLRARLVGAMAVYAAAWWRTRSGQLPLEPDPERGHAADYLRMLLGAKAEPAQVAALDTYLVTVADHGMNASTFTARVVASTDSDSVSAVVAALGALKGPRHGGAPGPVLEMLEAIGRPENASDWLDAELAAGRRVMGLGHRVYRVRDPRAAVFETAVLRLREAGVVTDRMELARAVERVAVERLRERYPDRGLDVNVEFYTAILLDAIGLPRESFAPTFAVGRVAGWLAHIDEQRCSARIIRPRARYVGD